MIEQWFPSSNTKKPEEFKFKSPNGIWYKSQDEYYKFLGASGANASEN